VIREATLADVPRIVAMGTRFIQETAYADRIGVHPEQMTAFVTRLITSDTPGMLASAIFVLEREGAVVGMIGLAVLPHFMSGEVIGSEMFWWVEPDARKGIGGVRLLKRAESWAKDHGAVRMHMIAPNAAVAKFYEAVGYHALEVAYERSL
jgi:GNAT superfamily N-acetyltransferase